MKQLTRDPPAATLALVAVRPRGPTGTCSSASHRHRGQSVHLVAHQRGVKYWIDGAILECPSSALNTKIVLARFSTYFRTRDVPIWVGRARTASISKKIVGNRVIEEGLQRVGREINDGTGIRRPS